MITESKTINIDAPLSAAKKKAQTVINDIKPQERHYTAKRVKTYIGDIPEDALKEVVYINEGNGYYSIEETAKKRKHEDLNYVLSFVYGCIISGIGVAAIFLYHQNQ